MTFKEHCRAILQLDEGRTAAVLKLLSEHCAITEDYNLESLLDLLEAVPELKETTKHLPERIRVYRGVCAASFEEARVLLMRPFWSPDRCIAEHSAETWLSKHKERGKHAGQTLYLGRAEVRREDVFMQRRWFNVVACKDIRAHEFILHPSGLGSIELSTLEPSDEFKHQEEVQETIKRALARADTLSRRIKAELAELRAAAGVEHA